tara:strand:+ start:3556 stop:4047 length:492 start_codon:yes stop_codon:yes gene_type:complete
MKEDKYYLELEEQGFYETVDKRSKDYREYKKWKVRYLAKGYQALKKSVDESPKGLGDSIAKITKVTGIETAVKAIAGDDCGCDERKGRLNKLFSYKEVKCISEKDYTYLNSFFSGSPQKVTNQQKIRLIGIYNFAFSKNQKTNTSCSPCISKVVRNLKNYLAV